MNTVLIGFMIVAMRQPIIARKLYNVGKRNNPTAKFRIFAPILL